MTMTTYEIVRTIIEALLSGTCIIAFATLRATRRKAEQDARRNTIDNDKALMDNFNELIVEPLKKEVNALRKDVRRFQRAIEKIPSCPHAGACPVADDLQKQTADSDSD